MRTQVPFPRLPYRFLLWGLVFYIVIETLGILLLQYMDGLREQDVILLIRLLELVVFAALIHKFHVLLNLGLHMPTRYELSIFLKVSVVCLAGVALLYALQPAWFAYITLPTWLHGSAGLFLMVVLAPVVEELIFRGLLYRMLREQWGVWFSVAVSAVFFSLIHHGMLFSPQLVGGMIFALAYEWSRSLWVSMALHMGANAAVYVLSVLDLAN